mgnify:FL=1
MPATPAYARESMNCVLRLKPGKALLADRIETVTHHLNKRDGSAKWTRLEHPSDAWQSLVDVTNSDNGGGSSRISGNSRLLVRKKVLTCALSSDGHFLAAGTASRVSIWDLRNVWLVVRRFSLNESELARFAHTLPTEFSDGSMQWQLESLHWLRNSRYCASVYSNGISADSRGRSDTHSVHRRASPKNNAAPRSKQPCHVFVIWDTHVPAGKLCAVSVIDVPYLVLDVDQIDFAASPSTATVSESEPPKVSPLGSSRDAELPQPPDVKLLLSCASYDILIVDVKTGVITTLDQPKSQLYAADGTAGSVGVFPVTSHSNKAWSFCLPTSVATQSIIVCQSDGVGYVAQPANWLTPLAVKRAMTKRRAKKTVRVVNASLVRDGKQLLVVSTKLIMLVRQSFPAVH